jgi:hypothetical protein
MIYAAWYRERPKTSIFDCARVEAETLAEAVRIAKEAVKARYPTGEVIKVFEAKKSPWGAKNADGKMCVASEVY